MISHILKTKIKDALQKLDLREIEIHIEHPTVSEHGDYSTNVAMALSKEMGKTPHELALKIAEVINNYLGVELLSRVGKVEVVNPGFINFFLKDEFFRDSVSEVLANEGDFGKNESLKGKKVIIEYTDPNPFKEFHIGHMMTNTIGESISRLFEFSGAEVKRANYQGDVGMHVAMAIWGMMQMGNDEWDVKDLGQAYAKGARSFNEDQQIAKEIIVINKKVYERSDEEINELYDKGKKVSLEYFEEIYQTLGTKFDYYFFESEVAGYGKEIIKENSNLFEKSRGAIVFMGENYGLHNRVFINSEGLPTYEAKELGLAKIKYDKFLYDTSIVVTGNEINEYFNVLIQVMKLVYERESLGEKTEHIGHGMLRLSSGKMSSRTGEVVTFLDLYDEVKEKVNEVMSGRDYGEEMKNEIAEKVSTGALKYPILRQGIGKDVVYDLEKSISFEGDSGPYLQYTYVRAMSLLEKAVEPATGNRQPATRVYGPEKLLYQFPEIVQRATEDRAPQLVTNYLIELAGSYNTFYGEERILESEDAPYKLALSRAIAQTLENGLYLLGIKVPQKM